MYPALPPNRTPGQLRQTVGIVGREEWQKLSNDERDAANALSLHVWWRCRQEKHPALEGEDCVLLSDKWVKRLLTEVRARKTGEKAAAAAIRTMQARGWIEDTGTTKKPRRSERSRARAERSAAERAPKAERRAAEHPEGLLVASVPGPGAHSGRRDVETGAGRVCTFSGRSATPSVSVGTAETSRVDLAPEAPFQAESGLRAMSVPAFRSAVTPGIHQRTRGNEG